MPAADQASGSTVHLSPASSAPCLQQLGPAQIAQPGIVAGLLEPADGAIQADIARRVTARSSLSATAHMGPAAQAGVELP